MRSEHHHGKVHADVCTVTREVKVLIAHQIWLIYERNMSGIIKLWDLQMHTIYCIICVWVHEPGKCVLICALLKCMFFSSACYTLHSGGFFNNATYSSAPDEHIYPPQCSAHLANLNQSLTLITSLPTQRHNTMGRAATCYETLHPPYLWTLQFLAGL